MMQLTRHECEYCDFRTGSREEIRRHVRENHKDRWETHPQYGEALSLQYETYRAVLEKPTSGLTGRGY